MPNEHPKKGLTVISDAGQPVGVIGRWAVFIWYLTPYVVLPWLYALNRKKWNK
jgi:hypothetical protein